MLFIIFLIEMSSDFKQQILKNYKFNLNWQRISNVLKVNNNDDENAAKLFFYWKENDLIFRANHDIESHDYEFHKLYISYSIIQKIFKIVHDDSHSKYARCYEIISSNYYIRGLIRYLRNYFKHCSKCQIFQTKKYKFYDLFQSILTSSISFYIIIINFVLTLLLSAKDWNYLMSIICKFIKRILLISDKST